MVEEKEVVPPIMTSLRRTAKTGSAEGAQEAAAGILQNLVTSEVITLNVSLLTQVLLEEGAIGAGSGAILQGIVDLFTRW